MTASPDYPDYLPIPLMTAVLPGSRNVSTGAPASAFVSPTGTQAVRLWTASVLVVNEDTTSEARAAIRGSLAELLFCGAAEATASNPRPTGVVFGYFGGIVLPDGDDVELVLAAGNPAFAYGTITYDLVGQ